MEDSQNPICESLVVSSLTSNILKLRSMKKSAIRNQFVNYFPEYYSIIGESNLNDLIDDDVVFDSSEGGNNSLAFEVIAASGTIITILKTFYDLYKDRKSESEFQDLHKRQELIESLVLTILSKEKQSALIDENKIIEVLGNIVTEDEKLE